MYHNPNRRFHNNIFLGDLTKLKKVEKAEFMEKRDKVASRVGSINMPARLYIAQHNFVDDEASGRITPPPGPDTRLPLLPGQAMAQTAGTTYIDIAGGVPTGTEFGFFEVLIRAMDQMFIDIDFEHDVWIDPDTGALFLMAVTYNSARYETIQTSAYTLSPLQTVPPQPPITDPLVNRQWTGWALTYFVGIHRPQRFETYPALAMNQYPIEPVFDWVGGQQVPARLDFTLDFTKTSSDFLVL